MDRCRRGVERQHHRVDRHRGRRPRRREPAEPDGFTGITDARFYINQARIPTVICGPGSLTVAHAANESVRFDDLVTGARAYARMFAAYLAA